MGKKIMGEKQPNGSVPWIYTDHGQTYIGVDYVGVSPSSYRIERDDRTGGGVYIKGDLGESIYFDAALIPFMIKALKKIEKK